MQKVLEPIQRVRFTKSTLRHASIREKKGPSLGKMNVKVLHQRSPGPMKRLKDSSDVPEARLGILPKTFTSSKKKTRLHSARPPRNGNFRAASTKESEERKFVVDSGASMHMVSEKDLDSAELETMRTSRSPTTVMTANGEVQTREEETENVKQLDLFVKVMLLETPAVLSLGELCDDHGASYHWISGRKTTSHQKWQKNPTVYHLWFLVYQRVLPQLHLHLLLHHLHHRIPYSMSTDTQKSSTRKKWKYEWRASGRPAA